MTYTQLKKKKITGCIHSIVQCKLKQIARTRFKKKNTSRQLGFFKCYEFMTNDQ